MADEAVPSTEAPETPAVGEGEEAEHSVTTEQTRVVRERSTVVFPYDELATAISVAAVVVNRYGGKCTMDQLAGEFRAKTTSGAFRNKVTTARIFALVTVDRQGIEVTDAGHRILDPATAPEAKVDAFLSVELYQKLYENFRGRTLPTNNNQALESVIRRFGVAEKQVATARWRFQKSAETAGFFEHGRDRLVKPALAASNGDDSGGGEDDGTTVTPQKGVTNVRSIILGSGAPRGAVVTLTLAGDLFSMDPDDRAFVLRLVDEMAKHEAASPPVANGSLTSNGTSTLLPDGTGGAAVD